MHRFRQFALMSADAGNSGTGGAAPAATATPAPVAEATKPAAPSDGGGESAEFWKAEAKKAFAERDAAKAAAKATPEKPKDPPPADAVAEVQKLRNEIALERAVSSSGLRLSDKQRATMEKLIQVEQPPDIAAWVKANADIFGAAATPPAQSQAVTNTGAPGSTTTAQATPAGQMPPLDVWRALSDEDKVKTFRGYTDKHSNIDYTFSRRTPKG